MNGKNIYMHGANIFNFTLNEIPKSIKNFLKNNHFNTKKINYFIFHQASKLAIDALLKILKLELTTINLQGLNLNEFDL